MRTAHPPRGEGRGVVEFWRHSRVTAKIVATFSPVRSLSLNMIKICSVHLPAIGASLAVLAGLALAGCGGSHGTAKFGKIENYTVNPPRLLAGPAALLLTNAGGFSARYTLAVSASSNANHSTTGVLLGLGPHLMFAPDKSDRTFIWDVDRNMGYLLSEAMQGYGPIRPMEHVTTNFAASADPPVAERVNGHPCHKADWIAECSDGSRTRCSVWRAEDLREFPVRIKAVERSSEFTVDLADVRLGPHPEKLFTPPADFTAYSSADAMLTEMLVRQTSGKRKPELTAPEAQPRVGGSPVPPNGRY